MKNVPSSCFKCGAPIKWDKVSSFITCEYCGATNNFKTRQATINNFKNKVLELISPVKDKAKTITKYCLEKQTLLSDHALANLHQ